MGNENKGQFDPEVLYEDNHLLVVNKPAGMLVQGDDTGDLPLIEHCKQYLKRKYNKPGNVFMGLVHRLDRPVGGVIVLARTGKALARLNKQFKDQHPQKTYLALVKNKPPKTKDRLVDFLKKNPKQNKSYSADPNEKDAKKAILDYEIIGRSEQYYLLKINLLTGRHHQIRCQLAHMGCSVGGDLKYGFPRSNPDGNISLHARSITISHPVRKESMNFTAELPREKVWQLFRNTVKDCD